MNIDKLKSQLQVFSGLEKAVERLHSQGFYSLFYTSFQSLRTQDHYFQGMDFKKCLQLIISELIDTVWSQTSFPSNNLPSVDLSPRPTQRISLTESRKSLVKSVSTASNLVSKQNIIGPATFTREKRSLNREIPTTPGPGDYSIENPPGRSKSPSMVFPREKRSFEIAHKDSPGPSAYSPSTHFQSKF